MPDFMNAGTPLVEKILKFVHGRGYMEDTELESYHDSIVEQSSRCSGPHATHASRTNCQDAAGAPKTLAKPFVGIRAS